MKIDRAVTRGILPQTFSMAETLSLEVIAEGIETQMQADFLDGVGRRIPAQGWLYKRPVSASEFILRLADEEKKYFEVPD